LISFTNGRHLGSFEGVVKKAKTSSMGRSTVIVRSALGMAPSSASDRAEA
jgi:hypothetical protein